MSQFKAVHQPLAPLGEFRIYFNRDDTGSEVFAGIAKRTDKGWTWTTDRGHKSPEDTRLETLCDAAKKLIEIWKTTNITE